ncbi:hypothetical protein Tco_0984536, partial [Tanacetum coccineum]
ASSGSAGGHVITAAGGPTYKENSRFKRKVFWSHSVIPTGHLVLAGFIMFLLVVPAGRLYGSYWSVYGFFCLPCPILFVIASSIIGPQTPLDLGYY